MIGFGPGSRNQSLGTVYQRMRGLIRSGAFSDRDKPLWFDVWEAFPPAVAPVVGRPVPKDEVKPILYPEDVVRAKFCKSFRRPLASIKNENPFKVIKSEVFVNEYINQQVSSKNVNICLNKTLNVLKWRDIYFEDIKAPNIKPVRGERGKRTTSADGQKEFPTSVDFSEFLDDQTEGYSPQEEFELRVPEKNYSTAHLDERTIQLKEDMDAAIDSLIDNLSSNKIEFEGEGEDRSTNKRKLEEDGEDKVGKEK